jgi:hypothetical protein
LAHQLLPARSNPHAGVAKLVDATDLNANLSALRETGDVELLKVGEPSKVAIPSQAGRLFAASEGVETRRAAPKASAFCGATAKG